MRTQAQKLAVKAIKDTAKKLIAEVDSHNYPCAEARCDFHLSQSHQPDLSTSYFIDQATGQKKPVHVTYTTYQSSVVRQ